MNREEMACNGCSVYISKIVVQQSTIISWIHVKINEVSYSQQLLNKAFYCLNLELYMPINMNLINV